MIANQMQLTLDEATTSWGVKVERVEMKDGKFLAYLKNFY
jgi:regulator of protease activity HflC (stomatin/prohibitin superfamily)